MNFAHPGRDRRGVADRGQTEKGPDAQTSSPVSAKKETWKMLLYSNGSRRAISGASLAQIRRRLSAAERAVLAADIVDGRIVLQGLTVKAIAALVGVNVGYVDCALRLTLSHAPRWAAAIARWCRRGRASPPLPSTGTRSATPCSSKPSAASGWTARSTPRWWPSTPPPSRPAQASSSRRRPAPHYDDRRHQARPANLRLGAPPRAQRRRPHTRAAQGTQGAVEVTRLAVRLSRGTT